jgi:hypothetical protein
MVCATAADLPFDGGRAGGEAAHVGERGLERAARCRHFASGALRILGGDLNLAGDTLIGLDHGVGGRAQIFELLGLIGDDLGDIVDRAGRVGEPHAKRAGLFGNHLGEAGLRFGGLAAHGLHDHERTRR